MGRHLEFERDDAVLKAMEIFWEKGYESTSLEDLLNGMGLSKSSFYNSFGSKDVIFKECLNKYVFVIENNIAELYQVAPSGREFITGIFDDIIHESKILNQKMGCFIMNSAMEFAQRDDEIAEIIKKAMSKIENAFLVAVEKSISEGDIDKNQDSNQIAQYLLCSFNGIKVMVKSGAEQDSLDNIYTLIISSVFSKK